MICPQCRHENPDQAKFCEECATPLALRCSSCGTPLSASAKFCFECAHPVVGAPATPRFAAPGSYTPRHLAEKILTSRSALEGERKQVTVLFADLKGSMELLADRDPEDARKLLDPVLELMMEAVHRYEGTVNQVMGDGIMALFGAPLAHEDHAVRACYAALRMQEAVKRYAEDARHRHGVNVQIRVGLNSGEVVVRAIGSDLHMDYTAVGQTTHLAARMEQLASPGSILVTSSTLELVEGYVAVKPLGPVPVKGLADPVEVYEVTGAGPARTRLQAAAGRGLTRFVGRDAELEQLRRAQQLAGTGHGQIAAIVGEAGVGKSRLAYEFTHSHRLQGWMVLESASVSYGKATSYLPVIELLKGYFKIQDRDDPREIREKVTGKLLTLDEALKPALPALLALLNVPLDDAAWQALDPGQRRQRTLDAVKRLLLREAREQPLLVIFEDLHWIDGETQAVLDTLVESLGSAHLLLLVNYRAEYQHAWSGKTYYSQMRLDALAAESAGELLEALLGGDPGLAPLKQLLVKRGNPFFLEETVRTLVETKALTGERGRYRLTQSVEAIQIPSTVQAVLAARIDRLLPEDKRLLQVASVVGKDVPFALLRAIAELPDEALRRGLDHLQATEFLYETGLYPDLAYSFKHALTHDVTYGGLLQDRRRDLHARIVDTIEMLQQDRLDGEIERLAHHAVRGELRQKAVHYLRQAGLKAAARSVLQEARAWFEQALAVLETLPESPSTLEHGFEIRLELRPVLRQLDEIALIVEHLREAETIAQKLNDDRRLGRVYAFLMSAHGARGELDEALAFGTRALAISRVLEDLELRILSTSYLGLTHFLRGEYEQAVELTSSNLAALPVERIYESFGIVAPPSVHDRVWLALSLAQLGRFAEAADYEAQAIRIAEPTHHAFTIGMAYYAAAMIGLLKGDWAKAQTAIERWIMVLRTINVVHIFPAAVASSAWVAGQLGQTTEALNRLRESEQLVEAQMTKGMFQSLTLAYGFLARAWLVLGRLDEARRLGDRAVKFSSPHSGRAAEALQLLCDIATHPDCFDAESGEAHYRQALALAEPRGMRPLIAHCRFGLGKLYRRTGKREQARGHLTTATTMYREMDMRFWLEQAETIMGALP
ncbi:MAG TPA: adenylate/guanylate cyclase domain-containing protein [Methylomirabilota bacterium]|nr:adenylate/guanylate cyclase domain-containing protein [Methylomirabilota bacterium]